MGKVEVNDGTGSPGEFPRGAGFVTVRDAARFLALSVTAVRRLVASGELPAYRLSGRALGALRLKVADLEAWAEGRKEVGGRPLRSRGRRPTAA